MNTNLFIELFWGKKHWQMNVKLKRTNCVIVNLLTLTCNRTFDSSIGHAKTAFTIPPVHPAINTCPNQYFCFASLLDILMWNKKIHQFVYETEPCVKSPILLDWLIGENLSTD